MKNNIKSQEKLILPSEEIVFKSFSKVNLGLWIKELRSDGYHELETVFCENKNLFDLISLKTEQSQDFAVDVSFSDEKLNSEINSSENIVYKAIKLFAEEINLSGLVKVCINKNVPIKAGLGGGSANAAYTLIHLNELLNSPLSKSDLASLLAKIGSDTSFFVYGNYCIGKGRGEILIPIDSKLDLDIKIIKPENISISTKDAFKEIDSRKTIFNHSLKMNNILQAIKIGDIDLLSANLFNDFESFAFKNHPELLKIKESLLEEGCIASGLCGSGSSIFGIKILN